MNCLEFLQVVFISVIIVIPITVVMMDHWLSNFAYRKQISWVAVGLAALSAVLIVFVTVSLQAFKAARMSPVNSLKVE